MATITFDVERCTRCGSCVRACAASVFVQGDTNDVPVVTQSELCISCGHCLAMCPTGAVTHTGFPEGTITPVDKNLLPTYAQVLELLRARRSVRVFTDEPVAREEIACVLDAVRLAPTAHNLQDVRYVVVQNKALLAAITETVVGYFAGLAKQLRHPVVRTLYRLALTQSEIDSATHMLPDFDYVLREYNAGHDPILHNAPCLLLAYSPRTVNFPEANASIALHNAALAAQAVGLGGFLLGYVVGSCKRNRTIPNLLKISRDHEVYAGLALGHPAIAFTKWIQRKPLDVTWK